MTIDLARLRRMSLGEIRCRGRQATAKWFDEVAPRFGPAGEARRGWFRAGGASVRPAQALARFVEGTPRRFFAGAAEPDMADLLRERFPEECAETLATARQVLSGRFDLLGYRGLDFGTPPDWHLDPVANRRAPLVHWRHINPLDPDVVGDSKVVWELNRHQWLVTLAQAYQLTGDETYAAAVLDTIDAWTIENPWGIGINWASSLEVSLRLMAWCWALVLLRRARTLTPERFLAVQRLARAHATHIERYLSYYFSPNTHLTGEALGLFYAGIVFADSPDAARWRDLGRDILADEIRRQILPDGGYFEQASCYHRYTIEIYLHFLILAARNGIPVPEHLDAAIARMLEWQISLCRPNHTLPSIGDADGGVLLPLVRRAPNDARGVAAVAAAWLGRPEFGWAAGGSTAEIAWLLGRHGLIDVGRLGVRIPAWPASRAFSASGYVVMRSDWQADAHQLVLDVGPLGCAVSGAHGHADLLSIQCAAFGDEYLVDPGTYCYTSQPAWRNHFRSTAAHNTVRVDGQEQALPAGPFSWQIRPAAHLRTWESTPSYDLVEAAHDGYARLTQPVRHRRRVLFVKPRGWIVVDDLTGAGEHDVELRFQFAPRPVRLVSGWARAEGRANRGLWLRTLAPFALTADIREGRQNPIDGWISPGYGVRRPAPVVVYTAHVTLPSRVTTVILPVERLAQTPPDLTAEYDAAGDLLTLRLPDDPRGIRIAAESLALEDDAERLRTA
jgi:hypothetical protein